MVIKQFSAHLEEQRVFGRVGVVAEKLSAANMMGRG